MAVIAIIMLIVVGPQKLPGMLRTVGQWIGKLRRLTTEVRAQTGIDQILREEGIQGGVTELRNMLRGDLAALREAQRYKPTHDPYPPPVEVDLSREHPPEGPDAYGAVPDDLLSDEPPAEAEAAETEQPAPGVRPQERQL
jgi:sec-independent protein translocase protein TatB